ncbi:MAG TPA: redoxin domain-containing protein [Vicinamibacterales bacterium]
MMRTIIRTAVVSALAALCLTSAPLRAARQDKESEYTDKLTEGDALLAKRQWEDALKAFKRASALRDKSSLAAHAGMARAYYGMGAYKNAIDSWTEALKVTNGDAKSEATCHNQRGMALFASTTKADKKVKDAEEDFRAAIALDSSLGVAHFNLGVALMRQSRDDEGAAELKAFIEQYPRLPQAAEARRYIDNPRRTREAFAPDFAIVTFEGERLALEDLQGRVVLLDFWASWCGPCKEAVPGLRRISKKYAERPFTLISVSLDRAEGDARDYIDKNQMAWHQYFDKNRRVSGAFGVQPIPTYVLLDAEGLIVQRQEGWSPTVDGDLDRQIDKLLKKAAAPK